MRDLKSVSTVVLGEGSRLELVLTEDPNGGLLVVWPDGYWLGRAFIERSGQVQLTTLAGRLRDGDMRTVIAHLVASRPALPWWTP